MCFEVEEILMGRGKSKVGADKVCPMCGGKWTDLRPEEKRPYCHDCTEAVKEYRRRRAVAELVDKER